METEERARSGWRRSRSSLALVQRPGLRVPGHEDRPARGPVGRSSPTSPRCGRPRASLGHVQGGQYGGYLFPMGPFFALGHAARAAGLGSSTGCGSALLLALARVGDRAAARRAGRAARAALAHLVAGSLYVLNPYVVVYIEPHDDHAAGVRGAAVAAAAACTAACASRARLVVAGGASRCSCTSSGGGVNAAVTAWLLLGPLLLAALRAARRAACAWRALRRLRAAGRPARVALASLWWVVPVLVQPATGSTSCPFTEQPGTIWGTTGCRESLRLMGYWTSYVGVGFDGHAASRLQPTPRTLLFDLRRW